MVRLGVKIKKRGKVPQRRKQKPVRKYKTKFVRDPEVQKIWNHNLTTRQNYVNLGLQANPNAHAVLRASIENADGTLEATDKEQLFDVPDSDFLGNERNPKRVANYVSEEEAKYLRKLIDKHGNDYKKMERDIKTNCMQWTEQKLQRRCARLALLDANILSKSQG